MREHVKMLARFFRCRPIEVWCLLDDQQRECLWVEARVNRARRVRVGKAA